MAVFGTSGSRIGGGRGPSFGFRFFCYAVLSVVLMFYDRRGGWLDTARYGLQAAIYPLQLAVNSPSAAWRWLEESFTTRETLQARGRPAAQRAAHQQLDHAAPGGARDARTPRCAASTRRCPMSSSKRAGRRSDQRRSCPRCASGCWSIAAARTASTAAQPVITGDGVLGQVFRIGPFSSEIILITDAEHALPVQVRAFRRAHHRARHRPQHLARTALRAAELRREGRRPAGHFRARPGVPVRPARRARDARWSCDPDAAAGADPRRAARGHRKRSRGAVHLGAPGSSGRHGLPRSTRRRAAAKRR